MRLRPVSRTRRRPAHRPGLERLETRALLATITVTSTDDTAAADGLVTLREAMTSINNGAVVNTDVVPAGTFGTNDRIAFNIPGTGVRTITLASALPTITRAVTIDGYTQPGASPNTLAVGDDAVLLIELNGNNLSPGGNPLSGLIIRAADSTIRGLVINRCPRFSIELQDAVRATILGNFLGTDAAGTAAMDNGSGIGSLSGFGMSANVRIGGTDPADRNLISGNRVVGIALGPQDANATVQGNYIGTDRTGNAALPSGREAINILNSGGHLIGGTAAGAGNVIVGSGATQGNILIGLPGAGVVIQGNLIGTNAAGTAAIGPARGVGITVEGGAPVLIGGTDPGARNVISGMGGGVDLDISASIVQGNFIGTDITGTVDLGNRAFGIVARGASSMIGGTAAGAGNVIAFTMGSVNQSGVEIGGGPGISVLGNSIFGNGGKGIILFGVASSPVLTSATSTSITGTLSSAASTTFRIEFYATPNTGQTGDARQQGKTLLGVQDVITDGNGNASFTVSPVGGVPAGQLLTATATNQTTGSTSEFSLPLDSPVPTAADLSVTQTDSPDPVSPGALITYTITVRNNGPDSAGGVTLTGTVPANTTFASFTGAPGWSPTTIPQAGGTGGFTAFATSLTNGATATLTFVVRVDPNVSPDTTISHTVSVAAASTTDPTPANNTETETTAVRVTQTQAAADLSVAITDTPDPVVAGNTITSTITVANGGPDAAQAVALASVVPANTTFVSFTAPAGWTGTTPAVGGTGSVSASRASLASGAIATFTLVVRVAPTTPSGRTISQTVNVSNETADANPNNNSDTATTRVQTGSPNPTADLAVTTFAGAPNPARAGQNLAYTIVVTNHGPSTATNVVLTDLRLPANAAFVSATAGSFNPANNRVVADLGTLAVGAARTVRIVVRPTAAAAGRTLTNTVAVTATQPDPEPANNRRQAVTTTVATEPTDTTGPTVVRLLRQGYHWQPTLLVLTFSEALDPARASNPANYRLVGPRGEIIPITAARYNAETRTVALRPGQLLALRRVFQLTVNSGAPGGLTDLAGNRLDGNRDGMTGGNYVALITRALLVRTPATR